MYVNKLIFGNSYSLNSVKKKPKRGNRGNHEESRNIKNTFYRKRVVLYE